MSCLLSIPNANATFLIVFVVVICSKNLSEEDAELDALDDGVEGDDGTFEMPDGESPVDLTSLPLQEVMHKWLHSVGYFFIFPAFFTSTTSIQFNWQRDCCIIDKLIINTPVVTYVSLFSS